MSKQQLSAFVDGALSGVSRELVTRHLASCHSCREKHTAWKAADEALRGALAWTPSERTLEEWSSRVELCLTAERKGLPMPEFTPTLLPVIATASSSAMLRMRELLEDARAKRVIASEPAPIAAPARDEAAEVQPAEGPAAEEPVASESEPIEEPAHEEVAVVAPEESPTSEEPVAAPAQDEAADEQPAEVPAAEEPVASESEPIEEPAHEEVVVVAPEEPPTTEEPVAAFAQDEAANEQPAEATAEEPPVASEQAPIEELAHEEVAVVAPEMSPTAEAPVASEQAPIANEPEPVAEREQDETADVQPVEMTIAEESLAIEPAVVADSPRDERADEYPVASPSAEEPVADEPQPVAVPVHDEFATVKLPKSPPAKEPVAHESAPIAAPAREVVADVEFAVIPLAQEPVADAPEPSEVTSRAEVPPTRPSIEPAPSGREPEPSPALAHSARAGREPEIESHVPAAKLVTSRDLSMFAGSPEPKEEPVRVRRVAEPAPRLSGVPNSTPRPAVRPARPQGVRRLVAACAVLALVLAASVFMPEVIRIPIPESWQPRVPRVEFVRRGARATDSRARSAETALRTAAREPVVPELVPQRPTAVEAPASANGDTALARATAVSPGAEASMPVDRPSTPDATPSGTPERPAPGAAASAGPSALQRTAPTPARTASRPATSSGSSEAKPTYVPDQPATIIPTKVSTSVRLSSPPARKAPEPERDEQWPLLCGEVRDLNDVPLEGALVELISPQLTVRTDRRGRFCVACPPGTRSLRVQAHGFRITERTVQLADSMVETHISLQPLR